MCSAKLSVLGLGLSSWMVYVEPHCCALIFSVKGFVDKTFPLLGFANCSFSSARTVMLSPILELIFMDINIEFHYANLHSFLGI